MKDVDCDARAVGRLNVLFAVIFAAVLIPVLIAGNRNEAIVWAVAVLTAFLLIRGIYLMRFRRKPIRHTLILGGPSNLLYLRAGWWVVPISATYNALLSLLVLMIIIILVHGMKVPSDVLVTMRDMSSLFVMKGIDSSVMDYIAMRRYYKEEAARLQD